MQQGANSATPPAKKAASTEPVVSRSPICLTAHGLRQSPFELAPGEPAGAEVLPIQQDQGTHRGAVLIHQSATRLVADGQHMDGHRIGLRPVSYTHLRAHETDSYLVCRLLLEKK